MNGARPLEAVLRRGGGVAGVLVTYATEHRPTRAVAVALADTLREQGLQADVEAACATRDLTPYDVVILGAPLCRGRWHQDAVRFLKTHCEALANRDVAIFALGQRTPIGQSGRTRWREQLDGALYRSPWLNPVSVALFDDVDSPTRKGSRRNQRDRRAIRDWALGIAEHALASG